MANPALVFHRISDTVYNLAAVRTGAVRCQLLRSTLVTQGLLDDGLIDRHRPLLVFGAGPAGLNAAVTAAQAGVNVHVLEIGPAPFQTFHRAHWRRVDPFEYDWPLPHHGQGASTGSQASRLFHQQQATGTRLAMRWAALWQQWDLQFNGQAGLGKVDLQLNTDATHFTWQEQSPVTVRGLPTLQARGRWQAGQGPSTRPFGALLSCTGFGNERTFEDPPPGAGKPGLWHGYRGPRFWLDVDGVPADHKQPLVTGEAVVSGGGDGAMQDVQRILTGDFGLALLKRLDKLAGTQGGPATPEAQLYTLLAAEDTARRAFAWQRPGHAPLAALLQWHQTYQAVVAQLMAHWQALPGGLQTLAKGLLRQQWLDGQLRLTWAYPGAVPDHAYGLNRFLCEVLLQLTQTMQPALAARFAALPGHRLTHVQPHAASHTCPPGEACLGTQHDVTLTPSPPGKALQRVAVGLLVVRHGLVRQPLLPPQAPVADQLLPYTLPA